MIDCTKYQKAINEAPKIAGNHLLKHILSGIFGEDNSVGIVEVIDSLCTDLRNFTIDELRKTESEIDFGELYCPHFKMTPLINEEDEGFLLVVYNCHGKSASILLAYE
jgi:hypothetical protein